MRVFSLQLYIWPANDKTNILEGLRKGASRIGWFVGNVSSTEATLLGVNWVTWITDDYLPTIVSFQDTYKLFATHEETLEGSCVLAKREWSLHRSCQASPKAYLFIDFHARVGRRRAVHRHKFISFVYWGSHLIVGQPTSHKWSHQFDYCREYSTLLIAIYWVSDITEYHWNPWTSSKNFWKTKGINAWSSHYGVGSDIADPLLSQCCIRARAKA